MSFRYRLRLKFHQWVHQTLRLLSSIYRDSSDLQRLLDNETTRHISTKARLDNVEASLLEARAQIQTLTISLQSASRDAVQFRAERDEARSRELESLRLLASKQDPIIDWFAQGCPRRTIYGMMPPEPPQEHTSEPGASRGVQAKYAVREQTKAVLQEIEERLRAQREAHVVGVMQPMDGQVNGVPV